MNEELKTIFGTSITVGTDSIPTAHIKYLGNSKTYVVWTIIGGEPGLVGNDECLYSICSVDVDIYSDGNYLDIEKEVKKLMKNNEWVWTEDSSEMFEEDTEQYHKTCTFEKERNNIWQESATD